MKLLYGTNSKTDFPQLTVSYLTFDEIALWNQLKNRFPAAHSLLLNFQLKICHCDLACLIVIVIIVTPWHTVLEELIMLR